MISDHEIWKIIKSRETEDEGRDYELAKRFIEESEDEDSAVLFLKKAADDKIPFPYAFGFTVVNGIKILINEHVLHPGPETVQLINESIDLIKKNGLCKVLDLCSGSGTISTVVAKETGREVTAIEISEKALEVAKKNAALNNVKINFIKSDMFSALNDEKFDIIISNPPYVKSEEIKNLPNFIKDFSPKIAIDGGQDGLYFHKLIFDKSKRSLKTGGILVIECESGQENVIDELLKNDSSWAVKKKLKNRYHDVRGYVIEYNNR